MSLADWESRRVRLAPMMGSYLPSLFEMETASDTLETWRLRGAQMSFEHYVERLWTGVADQRLVLRKSDDQLIGLVQLYNVDLRLGHGWFSVISHPDVRGSLISFEGAGLFIARCFESWGLRRLYFASVGSNMEQYPSVFRQPGCTVYGALSKRAMVENELVDVTIGGIEREPWLEHFGKWFPRKSTHVLDE